MPSADIEVSSALVPLATARQCLAPVSAAYCFSNLLTILPLPRYHLPLRSTPSMACSSV